jgi:hypothetical protein
MTVTKFSSVHVVVELDHNELTQLLKLLDKYANGFHVTIDYNDYKFASEFKQMLIGDTKHQASSERGFGSGPKKDYTAFMKGTSFDAFLVELNDLVKRYGIEIQANSSMWLSKSQMVPAVISFDHIENKYYFG